ncbi:protein DBF4 homolog B [Denticeps clupeoides]|uniref:protein DBF4 homolog B n=1 Tax=Denticeps clupeoides TaxID=299321 RepID=UPI0010A51FDD|nr:protein DBF4 homolog B-like [Denticeps clupeoides]
MQRGDARSPGPRPLKGKSFYMDLTKSRQSAQVADAVTRLGGTVESFLNKDVDYVVTGSREAGKALPSKGSGGRETPRPEVCGSRGRALLEKAIRNNERCQGSGVLANARSWGVKIFYVDDFLVYVNVLAERCKQSSKRAEKKPGEAAARRVVRAAVLKSPYLKVEDSSRTFRPLYCQSMKLPALNYAGTCSPFHLPAPPGAHKETSRERSDDVRSGRDKPSALVLRTPSPKTPRKKALGYCECCQVTFKDQEEHLQSDQHQHFARDSSNYAVVDQLRASMDPALVFRPRPQQDSAPPESVGSPVFTNPSPLGDLEPQGHSETERALQALLTPITDPNNWDIGGQSPTRERLNVSPDPDTHTALSSNSHPVPLPGGGEAPPPVLNAETSTSSTTTSSNVPAPPTLASVAPGSPVLNHEAGVGSRWFHSTQDCGRTPRSPLLPCQQPRSLFALVNLRKRSRSFGLSPNPSKRFRTGSDPGFCPMVSSTPPKRRPPGETSKASESHDGPKDLNVGLSPVLPPIVPTQTLKEHLQLGHTDKGESSEDPSELGPPILYPFFHDEPADQQRFPDPPELLPVCPVPTAGLQTSNTSLLSKSFSSVCIESALLPDLSTHSSESDWDSGLLSRLTPAVPLQVRRGSCKTDLGLLLQTSCMQDNSYESRLCSVLHQMTAPQLLYQKEPERMPLLST